MIELLSNNPAVIGMVIGAVVTGSFTLIGYVVKELIYFKKTINISRIEKYARFSSSIVNAFVGIGSTNVESPKYREALNNLNLVILEAYSFSNEMILVEAEKLYDLFFMELVKKNRRN